MCSSNAIVKGDGSSYAAVPQLTWKTAYTHNCAYTYFSFPFFPRSGAVLYTAGAHPAGKKRCQCTIVCADIFPFSCFSRARRGSFYSRRASGRKKAVLTHNCALTPLLLPERFPLPALLYLFVLFFFPALCSLSALVFLSALCSFPRFSSFLRAFSFLCLSFFLHAFPLYASPPITIYLDRKAGQPVRLFLHLSAHFSFLHLSFFPRFSFWLLHNCCKPTKPQRIFWWQSEIFALTSTRIV